MADSPARTPDIIRRPRTISQGSGSFTHHEHDSYSSSMQHSSNVSGSESPSSKLKYLMSADYSPETRAKMIKEHLQRQISTQSRGRIRSISGSEWTGRVRTDSMGSIPELVARRPSLSFSHADEIPFFIEKPTEEELDLKKGEEVPWWTSKRLILSVTCFVGFFCLYSLRVNLSTAIVCMTRPHKSSSSTDNITFYSNSIVNNSYYMVNQTPSTVKTTLAPEEDCPILAGGQKIEGEFEWEKELRGLILGAFFWGYTVCQIPSGILSDRFGPRLMISLGMFPVAILTIISPFLAKGSPYLLLIGRMLIGCGEAMMYPGMQSLWSKWSPPHERSRLVGFAFGGSQLGNALTFPISGLLCAYGFHGGWPSVFYCTGLLCFAWCCVYWFYARDSPAEMASISEVERRYIEQSLGTYGQTVEKIKHNRAKAKKPWLKILASHSVWAILLANSCGNYGAYMLLTMMPTYMKEVLKFDIKAVPQLLVLSIAGYLFSWKFYCFVGAQNGAYSMIPYLVFWVFIIIGGQIADVFISKSILTIEWTRKLMCAVGMIIPAIFLVLTGYMDCQHQTEAVVLLSLSMGFCGFQFSSFFINHGDIAPRFAGTIFGITNTGASIPGIIAPYIVGAITKNGTREEWLIAFYIAAGVQVLGVVIYAVLAKGEIQEWAKEELEFVPEEELEEIKEDEELNEEMKSNVVNEKKGMLDGKTSVNNKNISDEKASVNNKDA